MTDTRNCVHRNTKRLDSECLSCEKYRACLTAQAVEDEREYREYKKSREGLGWYGIMGGP